MIKTLTKIGNSQGIIFDTALMDLAKLKPGDQVNLEVHAGGAITLTPIRPAVAADEAGKHARELVKHNAKLFKRLS